jgi:hypothetical protein
MGSANAQALRRLVRKHRQNIEYIAAALEADITLSVDRIGELIKSGSRTIRFGRAAVRLDKEPRSF